MTSTKKHIAVGLSGGVDSSVTALQLIKQGHEVCGIFMQNWAAQPNDPYCTAEQDLSDARAVADRLNIPLHVVNFSQEYWDEVFQHCLDEFAQGRTPNPDIWCNKYIKFDKLLKYVNDLGADYLATGHYAAIESNSLFELHACEDITKDQTYFLYTLQQHQLRQALFPLCGITKKNVRALAQSHGLITHDKKDSTGICFIGERKFKTFLQEFLLAQPGDIKTTSGEIIGTHDGVMYYTLGQRKGLGIGGVQHAPESPWFVIEKDCTSNTLVVAQGAEHKKLFNHSLTCSNLHWIAGQAPELSFKAQAKIRYRQVAQSCEVSIDTTGDQAEVIFDQPQRAITPGQSIVFYQDKVCLGGATIDKAK